MTAYALTSYPPKGRYGLKQVIRSEAAKIATLRSTLWTLLITVAGMTLVTIVSTNSSLHHGPDWYQGFDPTNGVVTQTDHVRVAVGRSYGDATPTSGTLFVGGGAESLEVDVRVSRI